MYKVQNANTKILLKNYVIEILISKWVAREDIHSIQARSCSCVINDLPLIIQVVATINSLEPKNPIKKLFPHKYSIYLKVLFTFWRLIWQMPKGAYFRESTAANKKYEGHLFIRVVWGLRGIYWTSWVSYSFFYQALYLCFI